MAKITYDYGKLLGRMRELNITQSLLGKSVGLSEASLNAKLGNKVNFKQSEITRICGILLIEANDIPLYFFTRQL